MDVTFSLPQAEIDELRRVLRTLGTDVERKVALQALRTAARVGQRAIRQAAPVGTEPMHRKQRKYGRLRDNIRVSVASRKAPEFRVTVNSGRAYWGMFTEFGTVRQPPRPWFTPAFDAAVPAMLQSLIDALGRGVRREAERQAGTLKKRATRR